MRELMHCSTKLILETWNTTMAKHYHRQGFEGVVSTDSSTISVTLSEGLPASCTGWSIISTGLLRQMLLQQSALLTSH